MFAYLYWIEFLVCRGGGDLLEALYISNIIRFYFIKSYPI